MKTETYTCQSCNIDVVRPVARGTRPKWCLLCRAASKTPRSNTCPQCGGKARSDSIYCSKPCAIKAGKFGGMGLRRLMPPPSVCILPARHPARMRRKPRASVWVSGPCAWCSTTFTDNQPNAIYCSPRCQGRAGRGRRGRFAISDTRRQAIYNRDKWTCQLCFDPVMHGLPSSDLWAPTLDHILCQSWNETPDHSDANLRLAHRWCNSVRGDERTWTAEVLRV